MASTAIPGARHRRFTAAVIQRILGVAAAACLAIDAYVHFHDAGLYDAVTTRVLSQATLFRAQASLAAAAGVALLIRPSRLRWAAALMIAGSAFGAVMLYRYVNVEPLARSRTCTSPPGSRPASPPPPGPKAQPPFWRPQAFSWPCPRAATGR